MDTLSKRYDLPTLTPVGVMETFPKCFSNVSSPPRARGGDTPLQSAHFFPEIPLVTGHFATIATK